MQHGAEADVSTCCIKMTSSSFRWMRVLIAATDLSDMPAAKDTWDCHIHSI